MQVNPVASRQVQRARLREVSWTQMSRPPATDEKGIIPRWIRRSMALGLARRIWRMKYEMATGSDSLGRPTGDQDSSGKQDTR